VRRGVGRSPSGGQSIWLIAGWGAIVVIGIVLVWFGFFGSGGTRGQDAEASPTVSVTAMRFPTAVPTSAAAQASPTPPQPTSPVATPIPLPTETPVPTAKLVAGDDGVNVRGGPDTRYNLLGYLDPGTSAEITGKNEDWYQIEYGDGRGWVFSDLVAATNTESVPVVQPPDAPAAPAPQPTAVPTAVPPTQVPTQPADTRGIVVNAYSVRGAPGPFGAGTEILFDLNVTNGSGQTLAFNALGAWVEQTGQFQKSWSYSSFSPNQNLVWTDKIIIPSPGSYSLWLAIEFSDGAGVLLSGPIAVTVE
jgi:hypothetical protein